MLTWNEVPVDKGYLCFNKLLETLSLPDALKLLSLSHEERVVIVSDRCKEEIWSHLRTQRTELGGLLLGSIYELDHGVGHNTLFVQVTRSLRSPVLATSRVSLRMSTQLWDEARHYIEEGAFVVGWYHSHPDLGAFFS